MIVSAPTQNRAPLHPARLLPLPLGAVRPQGWLLDQLRTQANGMTGHLDEFWPSVGPDSGWLGGDGENWERGPYYLDGLLPLAHLLADERLLAKVRPWIEWSLQSQDESGWFGPRENQDWWPRMVMLKVLVQHHEATGDERVIPFMDRYFRYQEVHIRERPLQHWAAARGGENIATVLWLYNRTGEQYLLGLAEELRRQTLDWTFLFTEFPHKEYTTRDRAGMENHVVNTGMALKYPALYWLQTGETAHRHASRIGIQNLMRYHGLAHGMFSGDELYAGTDPSQGTELCGVVEYMYSLEHLARIFAETEFADILEKVTFNALPATLSADMWTHQYNQQPNQVGCTLAKRNWTWTNDESNLFGLQPFFGCCTANFHQGWPKFTTSLWAATGDGGLAAVAWAPCHVTATVADGVGARIRVETAYPFEETIRCTLSLDAGARFPLLLRIPGWCENAELLVNGAPVPKVTPWAGTFCRVEREWQDGDVIELRFPMAIRAVERPTNRAVAIERGPLVFALQIGEEWRRLRGDDPSPDFEVHPTTPWNYGLLVDRYDPAASFVVEMGEVPSPPFAGGGAPVRLVGHGRRIPHWKLKRNSADTPPPSPVSVDTPTEPVVLVPYGAARLRIAEFPTIS